MFRNPFREFSRSEIAIIIGISILLIVAVSLFVHRFKEVRRDGAFARRNPVSDMLMRKHDARATTPSDTEYIDVWMTFRYVETVFGIPDGYLKEALSIEDARYPDVPIGLYVKKHNLDRAGFVLEVRKAVRTQMNSHPAQ